VVTVLTDSVACLSPELRTRLGIGMQAAVDAGADGLLGATLPARLSTTFDSARAAARIVDVPAAVVDSKTVAAAQGLYVRRLAEEALDGADLDELVRRAEERRGSYRLEFVLEGLRRLAYSGRMPSALARFGDAIDVKPMLTMGPEAEVRPIGAVRGIRRGIDRIHQRMLTAFPEHTPGRAVVSHALLDEDARQLAERLRADRPELEIDIALFTPVMAASIGPIIGVAWEDPELMASG
jgi:DegV family protein with EDD domain